MRISISVYLLGNSKNFIFGIGTIFGYQDIEK